MKKITLGITPELIAQLGLAGDPDELAVGNAIGQLAAKAKKYDQAAADLNASQTQLTALETQLADLKAAGVKAVVTGLLDAALTDKKINVALQAQFAKDYATNPDGLKVVLASLSPYKSVTDAIAAKESQLADLKLFEGKSWDDLMKADLLPTVKADHPELYKALYKKEFGFEPK